MNGVLFRKEGWNESSVNFFVCIGFLVWKQINLGCADDQDADHDCYYAVLFPNEAHVHFSELFLHILPVSAEELYETT